MELIVSKDLDAEEDYEAEERYLHTMVNYEQLTEMYLERIPGKVILKHLAMMMMSKLNLLLILSRRVTKTKDRNLIKEYYLQT